MKFWAIGAAEKKLPTAIRAVHKLCRLKGGGGQKLLILRRHSLWTTPNAIPTSNTAISSSQERKFVILNRFSLLCIH